MNALRVVAFLVGILLVGYTFISATRTFVVPRSASVKLTRFVFTTNRRLFDLVVRKLPTYEQRDSLMAIYAPLTLLIIVPTWLMLTTIGYALMFWATGMTPFVDAFLLSGSSILTLGFATADSLFQTILAFTEATIGLILVAMLISYLPTMYSAFSRRETAVSLLEVRAGIPPTAPELLWRLHQFGDVIATSAFWASWEQWFTEIDESHTSLAALVFFRSPQSHQSWVNAAGAVLDASALHLSMLADPKGQPALVLRAGNQALRHIADFFQVTYNPDPHFPQDPISVTREEFNEAYDRLASQGVKLYSDRDLAWKNFAGWRVNYDSVLNALKRVTMAPPIPWVSDHTFVPASEGQTSGELRKVK